MSTLFDLPETTTPPKPRTAYQPDIPRWVTLLETTTGAPASLSGGKTLPHQCRTCKAWTLTGYDAPYMAAQAYVDPFLATPLDELAAIILAIPTYRILGWPPKFELSPRHIPSIQRPVGTFDPANPGEVNVVIAHTCKPALSKIPLPRATTPEDFPETPPF